MSAETIKVLNDFFIYAEKMGLEILQGDKTWLRRITYGVDVSIVRMALRRYIEIWQENGKYNGKEYTDQNQGRFQANTYIRKLINKGE